MFRNYLKIAWRNIWKNKVFSMINIIGLSIGLSSAFVVGAMVYYDMTFDKFHKDGDRIYRVTTELITPEGNFYNPGVAVPLAKTLEEEAPAVEIVSPFYTNAPYRVENMETKKVFMNPEKVIYCENNYFQIFEYQWLAGDASTALSGPGEVVLTEKRARLYFPDTPSHEIMGRTLVYNDSVPIVVTGIVGNFKDRTDLIFEEFISTKSLGTNGVKKLLGSDGWGGTNSASQLFLKVKENADIKSLKKQLNGFAQEHADKEAQAFGQERNFFLQPLADLHFNPDYSTFDYGRDRANKSVLMGLGLIALFLLLLGCINFINLNTARSTQRAKEIGIRKTLGSSKKQLVYQFLGETLILTLAAAVLSLFISSLLLRVFADFLPSGINLDFFKSPLMVIAAVILLVVITLLSGFYPALILSNFKPISVLKNQVLPGNNKSPLRKYLTVVQFTIAQLFIIATFFIGKQLHFLMTKDMGFKTDAISYIRTPFYERSLAKNRHFMYEIKAIPQIKEVTLGGSPPASRTTISKHVIYRNGDQEHRSELQLLYGDSNYLKLYNLKLVAGRMPLNDTVREYVVNNTFIRQMSFKTPDEAVGKLLGEGENTYPIVGVLEDFYQRSLHTDIMPMALVGDWYREEYSQFNTVHISFDADDKGEWMKNMAKMETVWKSVYPDYDFDPQFMDDTVKQFYEQERKTSVLLGWATGLAILISCMGLLGLVIHTTEKRTKEMGIRKVLGATVGQLNVLLCREFLILVGIAFLIAAPIAYWGTNDWLQDFAYRTELSWWVFLLSGMAMLLIALIIISIRTLAAANKNPVNSLRSE